MANLPRLLEEGRVEVRLVDKGTHVLDLIQVDALIAHLQSARKVLMPKRYGCFVEGYMIDGCVMDTDEPEDCDHAETGLKREECEFWRVIE